MRPRLAIDIGGTFTDVLYSDSDGQVRELKVSTTPQDIAAGIFEGAERIGTEFHALDSFVHGTTIALNALLERKFPSVGLVTTNGFRDVLEIMRTNRPDMYDLQQSKPRPLVPRRHRREISARMDYTGAEMRPVDRREVRQILEDFRVDDIDSIAICLLNSYEDPSHEQQVLEVVQQEAPEIKVTLSSDVSRVWREFERTSTSVANAASKPIVSSYLDRLEHGLTERGFSGEVLIMQSNGGVMSAPDAHRRPVATLMSGPVGGVTGGVEVGRGSSDAANLITLDMGGTSADVAIIDRGNPVSRTVGHIERWPIMVPMIDIESIGAGGGSIAHVDEFGGLYVGPESAGADPGPACYGRGGRQATVTDANTVLGRIDPGNFLGGDLTLDGDAATDAVHKAVAEPYSMRSDAAAEGIITVINSNMTRLLWEVMIGRGYDPRDFKLLAFGGAGPLHACDLARALGINEVLIPPRPGTFSALGILGADVRHDVERMVVGILGLDSTVVANTYSDLEGEAENKIKAEHAEYGEISFVYSAELRYAGQEHWVKVEVPAEQRRALEQIYELFHQQHERLYGFTRRETPIDLLRLEVSASARRHDEDLLRASPTVDSAWRTTRQLYSHGVWRDVPFYARLGLRPNEAVDGPCVIDEAGSTTYVPDGFSAGTDSRGVLHITVPAE